VHLRQRGYPGGVGNTALRPNAVSNLLTNALKFVPKERVPR